MRTQIMEVLDMDLIRQQADNNAVDIQGLATYIINTMGKMCAPVRDEEVKKLRENPGDIVSLFKYVLLPQSTSCPLISFHYLRFP